MRTWIKLYTEILRDPKMGRLTDRQGWTFTRLLLLAGTVDGGTLGSLEDIAWSLRIQPVDLSDDLAVLSELGMVEQSQIGDWTVVNFEKRQARPPSAEPEAVTERVKRHRENMKRECNEDVTTLQRGVTPSDPEADQIQSRSRQDTEAEADTDQAPTKSQNLPADAALRALLALPDMDEAVAQELLEQHEPGYCLAWAQYAASQGKLENPAGYCVKGIRSKREPPAPRQKSPPKNKWLAQITTGQYADIIRH
ncbi:MAG: hypothetical protein ABFD92_20975 [Planctomycetaceae bacterium]